MYKCFLKRAIDVVLSACGLIAFSWLFLILAIAIKIDTPGPVFFRQKRIGLHRKHFNLIKFRTMRTDTPSNMPTHMLDTQSVRFTKLQRFLRKSSLDELPQCWCILIGTMSIIGPRPALWNQDDLIAERDKYSANDVKPGLTGWAQINGRDELPIVVKARLDGEYAEKIGFGFDVKCFFGTVISVLKSNGVVEGGTGAVEAVKLEQKEIVTK